MRRRKNDETTPDSKDDYEQSYGDAQAGGWAPRRRVEDLAERSRYSSQRDRQEDRSGFRRGWQGQEETSEQHRWGNQHTRGDEDDEEVVEGVRAAEPAAIEATAWVERRRNATRNRREKLAAKRKRSSVKKRAAKKRAPARASARKKQTRRKARTRRGE